MLRYKNMGYTIRFDLSTGCRNNNGYSVECTYIYNKDTDKYSLAMYLCRSDLKDRFKIDRQEIDTQEISGTKDTIKDNIRKIVEYMDSTGWFAPYIEECEYMLKCFDRGNDLFESERLSNAG